MSRIVFAATIVLLCVSYVSADQISLVSFCTSCHGTDGAGPGKTIPYISGQSKEYLAITLKEMKNKERYATLMQAIAQGYDDEEIDAIAEWFAAKKWQNSTNEIKQSLANEGKAISESCASCHGEAGEGFDDIPRISGQPIQYLYNAMQEYKKEMRNNDGGAIMMEEFIEMDDESIHALAEYYSGLR